MLRREALRRGMGTAGKVVLLIDGVAGLENMGQDCFKDSVQIVDFYHAMEHAGKVLEALWGKNHPWSAKSGCVVGPSDLCLQNKVQCLW